MTRFIGWPARGRQDPQAELLNGRPCCCLAANGSGIQGGECCSDCRYDDGN